MGKNEHFDIMDMLYEQELMESYIRDTEEFKQWLAENHMYYVTIAEAASQASVKWHQTMLSALGNMIQSATSWLTNQMPQDTDFINQNSDIIMDPNRFPVKLPTAPQVPAYSKALQRLSTPLASSLKGFDISKIEDDAKANLAFKKSIIPTYDGKTDFSQYAKAYFGGSLPSELSQANPQQMNGMVKLAQQFCTSIKTRMNSIKQDADNIVSFLNDSSGGNTGNLNNQLRMDQLKLQQMQNTASANRSAGMASTSPGANSGTTNPVRPVNADTDYHYFMEEYFSEAMPGTQPQPQKQTQTKPNASGTQNTGTPTTPTSGTNATADKERMEKMPNGATVDPNKLAERKRQIMIEITRQVLAAKLSATLKVYHDLMTFLRLHVRSYGRNVGNPQPNQPNQTPTIQQQQQTQGVQPQQ